MGSSPSQPVVAARTSNTDTLSGEMSVTTQNQPQLASSVTSLLYQGDNVPSLTLVWYLLFQGEQCDPEDVETSPVLQRWIHAKEAWTVGGTTAIAHKSFLQ